jgi:hypothetical protein
MYVQIQKVFLRAKKANLNRANLSATLKKIAEPTHNKMTWPGGLLSE